MNHCPYCSKIKTCLNCYYGQIESKSMNFECCICENKNEGPTSWKPLGDNFCRNCGRKLVIEI